MYTGIQCCMRLNVPHAPRLVDQLRNLITTGALGPGAPLRQIELAKSFGVSRIPIRDALGQLHAEGLVEIGRDRGTYVTTLTEEECAEIFDLRVLLEHDALIHAVPRHTPHTLRRVAAIQAELELTDHAVHWAEGDRQFHEALYEPGERARTTQLIRLLRNVVERFAVANLSHDARRAPWKAEHRALLDAVTAGDAVQAGVSLVSHLRATEAVVRSALRDRVAQPHATHQMET